MQRGLWRGDPFEAAMKVTSVVLLLSPYAESSLQHVRQAEGMTPTGVCQPFKLVRAGMQHQTVALQGELVMGLHGRMRVDPKRGGQQTAPGESIEPWLPLGVARPQSAASEMIEARELIRHTARIRDRSGRDAGSKRGFPKETRWQNGTRQWIWSSWFVPDSILG